MRILVGALSDAGTALLSGVTEIIAGIWTVLIVWWLYPLACRFAVIPKPLRWILFWPVYLQRCPECQRRLAG